MRILITGVHSGIGRALAENYLENGDEVFGISRHPPESWNGNSKAHFLPLDLADFEALEQSLPAFLNGIPELDLVVLNAGILGRVGDMGEVSLEELKQVMDVNVWANKVLLDTLYQTGGGSLKIKQVVAISSGAAVSGARGWNGYSISKAALNMLIQLYAAERPETHFSALAPGLVDTGMQAHIASLAPDARFSNFDRLRKARGTSQMPPPDKLAPRLSQAFGRLLEMQSGVFADIRTMGF